VISVSPFFEKLPPAAFFEQFQLRRHRRLADEQMPGCPADSPAFGGRIKGPELIETYHRTAFLPI